MRLKQRIDSWHHRLRDEHQLETKRTRDIHQRGRAGSATSGLNLAIARSRYAGYLGDLLLRQTHALPRCAQKIADFRQGFRLR